MGILDKEFEEFQKQRLNGNYGYDNVNQVEEQETVDLTVTIKDYENLNISEIMETLENSRKEFLNRIRIELTDLIKNNAMRGVSVFSSQPYAKHQGVGEQNPYSKITQDDVDVIIEELKAKGFTVTTNMFSRENVIFNFVIR